MHKEPCRIKINFTIFINIYLYRAHETNEIIESTQFMSVSMR